MTQTILNPDEVEGWRGEIRDGQVVKDHDTAMREEEEAHEREQGGREGDRRPQREDRPLEEEREHEGEHADQFEEEKEGEESQERPARPARGRRGDARRSVSTSSLSRRAVPTSACCRLI